MAPMMEDEQLRVLAGPAVEFSVACSVLERIGEYCLGSWITECCGLAGGYGIGVGVWGYGGGN